MYCRQKDPTPTPHSMATTFPVSSSLIQQNSAPYHRISFKLALKERNVTTVNHYCTGSVIGIISILENEAVSRWYCMVTEIIWYFSAFMTPSIWTRSSTPSSETQHQTMTESPVCFTDSCPPLYILIKEKLQSKCQIWIHCAITPVATDFQCTYCIIWH